MLSHSLIAHINLGASHPENTSLVKSSKVIEADICLVEYRDLASFQARAYLPGFRQIIRPADFTNTY